jgi:selenocysteine lyase/cysteine desulfurase
LCHASRCPLQVALENDQGLTDLGALEATLRQLRAARPPLILGSFSAGSNVTGIAADTRALSRLLHRYGGVSAFDYASAAACGRVRMADGVTDALERHDVAMLSPHKFAGGPGSCGVLVIRKSVLQTEQPHVPGVQPAPDAAQCA